MVYTLLSGPMLYTLFPCFPKEMVYTIPRGWATVRERRGATVVVYTMRHEMITQIIRKQFFCVTDVHVIGKLIPRQLMCVNVAFTESTL